ncbi:MAG: helix-turn-helix transcriptional regulator [Dehalococcoides mccartyi]|jgi:putative transcriptional regulator|uniref:Helix-turn-helix transcriptional regulator n=1 Tax=Dehalococcoides mccartyi TaxID=61435 RepID=A0A0V8M0H0_9CHLR|nr:helix-turn-helix transcriptional regulator [Dehalococcoides mccartyi]APH12603.1 hypothetical protein ASJ33_05265 [Dehalococcoides mccartyi]AQU03304.1 helix-turn-helix domain-containing protein [Dehalococcoides mccartyi]AQU04602.1 helix-turn-helix domain-containing protein [Dehalococcoides mccartyi]KSV17256.1 XRE family transcriptional regulator [Dehalococcoides mccartyi]MDN4185462.1 helix-turn-helix transcriptional regulator [Dehalococcoides mccartyi]
MKTLKELRLDRLITQTELAKLANLSRAYISQIEKGQQKPSELTIRKISKALEINPEEIEF